MSPTLCDYCRDRPAIVVVTDRDGDDISLCAIDYDKLQVDPTLPHREISEMRS